MGTDDPDYNTTVEKLNQRPGRLQLLVRLLSAHLSK